MDSIAPPGTEDEPLISFSTTTKQEKERERLLSIKAVLPNGQYGPVFEFKYINGTEHWYCNACACPVMGWVYHHETGKRHSMALGNTNQDRFPNTPEAEETSDVIQLAPGEPVPPGFEGQVEKIALIQERLDVFTVGPLVALEYLLELRDYDETKEPTYLCLLCDKKGDPRTVLTHIASFKHIVQKHFPTCYRALAPFMTKQYKRNWQIALHEVAEAIEKKFGRLKPMPIEADKYEKDPVYYIELIGRGRHFSELSGYTFEEYVTKDILTKVHDDEMYGYNRKDLPLLTTKGKSPSPPIVENPIKRIRSGTKVGGARRRSLSSVSSISSDDFDASPKKKVEVCSRSPPTVIERKRSRSPYTRRNDTRYSPRNIKEPYHRRRDDRNLMPWEKSNYRRPNPDTASTSSQSKPRNDKLDEYKKLSKAIDNDMDRVLTNHKKNPEKHPQYNDEWKKFWNKRYQELQAEKKDVSTHDFKPEWIQFWNKRMIDLHQEEIKAKKEALRRRLGLPEEPQPISFKIAPKRKPEMTSNKPVPPSALPDHDPEVIVIDDRDDERRRSHSPWEDDARSREKRERSRDKNRHSRSPVPRDKSRNSRERERRRYSRSPLERDLKEYRRERIRIVSELPWERDRHGYRNEVPSCYKPPAVMRDVTREPVLRPPHQVPVRTVQIIEEPEEDIEINVVAVLRLLTALEEKLGSLGPKIIDLLAQALAMEKTEANSSETLLDNEINCVMFETVKEKLKGQLLAGLVEPMQERAFKNAIKKIASLIHLSGERKKDRDKVLKKVDPVKVPGVGTVDKAAIAKQIANALVLQGKTDVTQAELEQLINAVVGMAEASRGSNKPMTTANFIEQMSAAKPKEPEVKPVEKTPEKRIVAPSVVERRDMEGLSDSDLQTLLQNFKDLSTEEQHGLISYLKKLEAREPDRVERLRKFVNLGGNAKKEDEVKKGRDRESPFSNRTGSLNPMHEEQEEKKAEKKFEEIRLPIDSDEEDYTFEDVVKAASKNVEAKEREIIVEKQNLDDTKAIISNIMSNINKKGDVAPGSNLLGLGNLSNMVSSPDFAKTLNSLPVNMASLANIVGSVQNMTNNRFAPQNVPRPSSSGFPPQPVQPLGNNYPPHPRPVGYPQSNVTYPNYGMYPPRNNPNNRNNNYNNNRW